MVTGGGGLLPGGSASPGGCLPGRGGGGCLLPEGGCLPGLGGVCLVGGGSAWSRGVCLGGGVCLVRGGCLPAPGGSAWSGGGGVNPSMQ